MKNDKSQFVRTSDFYFSLVICHYLSFVIGHLTENPCVSPSLIAVSIFPGNGGGVHLKQPIHVRPRGFRLLAAPLRRSQARFDLCDQVLGVSRLEQESLRWPRADIACHNRNAERYGFAHRDGV